MQKISSVPELIPEGENNSHLYRLSQTNVDMSYKNFITPRDTNYKAKPFMFDRFNYENYLNYEYKNPYKPQKMGQ